MNKKRTLIFGIVLIALCLLIYLQIRAWKTFDWHMFWSRTEHIDWLYAFYGLALTYFAYVLRAVRWRIFLKPVRKTTTTRLLAPQFVGFAALALLGRAGEMIRPYIIAKKERLTFTSQIAVWGVERIFDMGAFAVLLALSFLSPDLRALPFYHGLRERPAEFATDRGMCWIAVVCVVALIVCGAALGRPRRPVSARPVRRLRSQTCASLARESASFSDGLETIQDLSSALQLAAVSILHVGADRLCLLRGHARLSGRASELTLPHQVVLMGSSMVGSMLQLAGRRWRLATGHHQHA